MRRLSAALRQLEAVAAEAKERDEMPSLPTLAQRPEIEKPLARISHKR
jgi:hypothetical protein